mmetsp:Transcript_51117/g.122400  ORF Transcript_51117/g.122400 Transcript_51117/m.122400 type:complete len:218 (-) Transcript_51117:62-715(-)
MIRSSSRCLCLSSTMSSGMAPKPGGKRWGCPSSDSSSSSIFLLVGGWSPIPASVFVRFLATTGTTLPSSRSTTSSLTKRRLPASVFTGTVGRAGTCGSTLTGSALIRFWTIRKSSCVSLEPPTSPGLRFPKEASSCDCKPPEACGRCPCSALTRFEAKSGAAGAVTWPGMTPGKVCTIGSGMGAMPGIPGIGSPGSPGTPGTSIMGLMPGAPNMAFH